jgi:GNAT superfamily N-acetyltransferase
VPSNEPIRWAIGEVEPEHDLSAFDCGKHPLNDFIRKHALINHALGTSRTFVATSPGSRIVSGYYCLSAGNVQFRDVPPEMTKGMPGYPVPVALIGKLAVDRTSQGQGLGELLLFDAFARIARASDFIGIHAVEVYAKDEDARGFYLRYDFIELADDRLHLYVPMRTLKKSGLV